MKSRLVVTMILIVALVAGLGLSGCAPPPSRDNTPHAGVTAGMCPNCGGTSFDVSRETERSLETGEEVEYITYTCRGCGHTTRAPAGLR